jgi:hypothetical protein
MTSLTTKTVDVQELAVVVTTKDNNPITLHPDFVKHAGLVPAEWQLAQEPICSPRGSQLVFENGVNLIALPDRLNFSQPIAGLSVEVVQIPALAQQYLGLLPKLECQAVGLNFRGFTRFESEAAAGEYLHRQLLRGGGWQDLGQENLSAALQLRYELSGRQLYLTVEEAIAIVVFGGNFEYAVTAREGRERVEQMQRIIGQWQEELAFYREAINRKFLAGDFDPQATANGIGTAEDRVVELAFPH